MSLQLIEAAFRDMAPWGYWMAGLGGTALLWAVIVFVARIRRRTRPISAWWSVPSLVAVVAALAVAVFGIQVGRDAMNAAAFELVDPEAKANGLAGSINLQMNVLALAFNTLVPTLIACILGAALPSFLRPDPAARRPRLAIFGLALVAPVGVVSWVGLRYILSIIHGFAGLAGVEPEMKSALLHAQLVEAHGIVAQGHVVVLTLGAIATLVLLGLVVRASREGARVGHLEMISSVLLVLAGVAAFVVTRPLAEDAARPLEDVSAGDLLGKEIARIAPEPVGDCNPITRMEILVVTEKEARLFDGPLQSPEDLHEQMNMLRNNYLLLHPNDEFPGAFGIVAPGGTSTATIARWLKAVPNKWPHPFVVTARHTPTATRTLGTIDRWTGCMEPLQFDDGAPSLSSFATWADVVRAAGEARKSGKPALRISVENGATVAEAPPPAVEAKDSPEACRHRCQESMVRGELREGLTAEDCVKAVCGKP